MARPKLNPDTIDKICPTCKKTFTISYSLRTRRTYCSKSCANHDPLVIAKMITSQNNTFNEKYGMHPMKTEQTKENLKASVKEKYGVEWISSSEGWYETVEKNNITKYGIEHYNNREQSKITCLEKYGVDNPTKSSAVRDSIIETKHKEHYKFLEQYCAKNNLILLFKEEQYCGYHYSNNYQFRCSKCNYIFNSSVYALDALYCE